MAIAMRTERPVTTGRMGTATEKGRAAPLDTDGPTDLLEFMRQVKSAVGHPNAPSTAAARAVLKQRFGSEWQVWKAPLSENAGSVGGYLLPHAISLKLLKSLAERSFIYPRALTVDMDTREVNAPIFDLGGGSTGQSPFVGGMSFSWGSEPAPGETDPVFANVNLQGWSLLGYTRVSNQFLADAGPEAEKLYVELFAMAAAVQAEFAFMQGSGVGQPLGMINSPCAIAVTRGAPNTIAAADVEGMAAKMIPLGWRNAIWTVSPSAIKQLFGITGFVPNGWHYHEEGCCGFLYTRPVFPTEKVPALGKTGDLCFFDPSLYVVGTRTDVLVSVSEHSRFANNQTEFMVVLRVDGKPLMNNSATLASGDSASQVVVLQ